MADDTPEGDKTVQLTPEEPASGPKLATVTPGPRAVTINVPAAAAVATTANVDSDDGAEVSDIIKKGELLDQVVNATGVKRADAKQVTETLFALLAEHLAAGTSLQVPPLGKLRLVNSKDVGQGGKALTVKIRTPNQD